MTATLESTVINGIDTAALHDAIEGIQHNPAAGRTRWSVTSNWAGGTRSDHHVSSCRIGETDVPRDFSIHTDEPTELCGTNQYANPQEYLISAVNACMMVGFAAVAALKGVTLTKLEVKTEGDIDLRGFLGIDPNVPAGYPSLRQVVTIAGDGSPELLWEIHQTVLNTSPNYFNIVHAIPMSSRLEVLSD